MPPWASTFQHRGIAEGADRRRRRPDQNTTSAITFCPICLQEEDDGLQLCGREQAAGALLARRRHARRLLRRQYGPLRGFACLTSTTRTGPCAPVCASIRRPSLSSVSRAARHGGQLGDYRRRHHLRRHGLQLRGLAGCARQLLLHRGRQHCLFPRQHRPSLPHPPPIIDRHVHIPEGTVIGYEPGRGQTALLCHLRPELLSPATLRSSKTPSIQTSSCATSIPSTLFVPVSA